MAATAKFEIGDLVWAKMKGFSPWPARIVEPKKEVKRPSIKKPMQCVFFFGTDNYAWILEDQVKHYEENKDEQIRKNKSSTFKEAVDAIEDYMKKHPRPAKSQLPPILTPPPSTTTAVTSSPEDETSSIFPTMSNKSGHHRDYSRTPFLSRTKIKNDSALKKKKVKDNKTKLGKRKNTQDTLRVKMKVKRPSDSLSGTGGISKKHAKTGESLSSWTSPSLTSLSGLSMTNSLSRPVGSTSLYHMGTPSSKQSMGVMRPAYVPRAVTPPPIVERISDVQRQVNVKASGLKFGFLGLGIMGRGIVKNLVNSGHHVTIWNRTASKCQDFLMAGVTKGKSPADVVANADITFCCVSDPCAAKEMVFGISGVLQSMGSNKGYIEMTSIDPDTAQDIAEAIMARGGRFLEAPVCGSKKAAEDGTLIILAAGDRSLFNDCATCFQAMGKHAFYLGEIGNGCKMNLVINMILGTMLAGLAEAMALADRTGLSQKDMVEVLELGSLNCSAIREKGRAIIEGTFPTNMPLQHMQKDLHLALGVGNQLDQPLPLTAAANEVFKHAKRLSYGEHDVSAVYLRARF